MRCRCSTHALNTGTRDPEDQSTGLMATPFLGDSRGLGVPSIVSSLKEDHVIYFTTQMPVGNRSLVDRRGPCFPVDP